MDPKFELCCGTIRQASLLELIEAAAGANFDAITVNPDLYRNAGLTDGDLRARLRDAGIRVSNIDGFGSGLPGIPTGGALASYGDYYGRDVRRTFTTPEDEFYRTAGALGGDSVNLVHFGGDPSTPFAALVEATAAICQRAAGHGLRIVIEFLPNTGVPDITTAAKLISDVGAANLEIMFDTRHLARTSGTPQDAQRHAHMVGAIQVSDLRWTTRDDPNRLLPGEGDLPLAAMVAPVLRAHPALPVGIEVFNDVLVAMPAVQAARAAAASLRMLMSRITDDAAIGSDLAVDRRAGYYRTGNKTI